MKKRLVIFFLAAAMVLGGCENKNSKLYKKGIEALEQKDYVTSIAMLEGAVKAGDRLAESYRSLGIAYLKSQEYDKAKEAFKSSLSSMKHKDAEFSRDVMYYEAETCVQAGDLDGAIEICTNIQEEKADADALFLRGRAYFLQKNYEQAKVDFDAAVETKESYQLCLDIYELYQESSMKADGDRYLEAAVKIEPKTTEDYYNIGCAYYYLEEQAEAVMDVISAKSAYALKSSESQLRGTVKKAIRAIREKLIYEIAFIESALDDPEHISLDGYPERLAVVVAEQKKQVEKLLASADEGKMIQEGIKTVILGKPNAGKSSLLNLLAGEEKAIVTDIAGTTRDVLEENLVLKGISLRILDTAGIRKTADTVEKIGVDRALEHAKDADLILYVVDASVPLDENDAKIMEILKGRKAIVLLNKSDLTAVIEKEEMEQKTGAPVISISAREETGMEELEEQMKKMFFQGEISFNDEVYITNARHKQALLEAKKSLELTAGSIEMGMPEDFFSIDLMNAYEELGSIIGEAVGEDLVNEIFSKFCTGK